MRNINSIDRGLRVFLGALLFELAYFWLAGGWQIGAYVAGGVMVLTALIRFCPVYKLLGIGTTQGSKEENIRGKWAGLFLVALVLFLAGASYASNFFTRKLFVEDFNAMNDHYKQTLFLTGKNEREKAIEKYAMLMPAYHVFQKKYASYKPFALKNDRQFDADLERVNSMLVNVNEIVRVGDLHQAHLDLEKVRPVFQEIFKRNGFSLLAVALVDFHDAMESMLEAANEKNRALLLSLYPQVSEKLKMVEAEANDAEIQLIRKNLDDLFELAKSGQVEQLRAKGDMLKSTFVKTYLQRG